MNTDILCFDIRWRRRDRGGREAEVAEERQGWQRRGRGGGGEAGVAEERQGWRRRGRGGGGEAGVAEERQGGGGEAGVAEERQGGGGEAGGRSGDWSMIISNTEVNHTRKPPSRDIQPCAIHTNAIPMFS